MTRLVGFAYRGAYWLLRVWWRIRRPITVGVRMMVVDPEGRVLAVRHSYRGGWHFPGGAAKRGETLEAAARREIREETGIAVADPVELLGMYFTEDEHKSDHVAVFVARHWEGEAAADLKEIVDIAWIAPDGTGDGLSPWTIRWLTDLRDMR